MNLENKVALVTGGASGLGEATVNRLVAGGARVAVLDLNDERGTAIAAAVPEKVLYIKTDVTSEDAVQAAVDATIAAYGRLDIAVNCAGIGPPKTVINREGQRNPISHFAKIVSINLIGSFNVAAIAAEAMLKHDPEGEDGERGLIINTASIAAFDGQIGQSAYSASKGGVVGMTLPLAREFARHGIRVMTIAPGYIHTPLFDSLPEKAVESLVATVQYPKRLGLPDEYASLVEHIANNSYLNGETIRMDAAVRMPPK